MTKRRATRKEREQQREIDLLKSQLDQRSEQATAQVNKIMILESRIGDAHAEILVECRNRWQAESRRADAELAKVKMEIIHLGSEREFDSEATDERK